MGEKISETGKSSPLNPARFREPQARRSHKIKWEDEAQRPRTLPCQKTVHVRVRFGGQIQTFEAGDLNLDIGDWVVVRQTDTLRIGLVTSKPIIWPANQGQKRLFLPDDRRILRLATSEDLTRQAENQLKERDDYAYCQSCITNLGLQMRLVAVEVTLDNFKTIFYYTAEERVDFRQLVRELVSRFRTRIEMRQIGVRLEALKLGGLGMCGRCFCCSSFLNNFCQVSVKMAKEQNLSLNTAKISGVCGRLMCCLSFENYLRNAKSLLAGQEEDGVDQEALADLASDSEDALNREEEEVMAAFDSRSDYKEAGEELISADSGDQTLLQNFSRTDEDEVITEPGAD
ncbi:MAG: stage 0 sporulation family protein [Deltaproteobacteria bacterium]|jgi:cell fate regulator YaaT (PSP1 superfamily)|nr:stage 0 sporulation family protein [Deltaproteobacteria bacterium]